MHGSKVKSSIVFRCEKNYSPTEMDFIYNSVWNATHDSRPLAFANELRKKIKSAPGDLAENARKAVRKTTTTSPADLISKICEPFTVRPVQKVVRCLKKKVPLVESVWEKLQVTPEEWYAYVQNSFAPNGHEDVGLSPVELIQKYGYPVEVYKDIRTEDGYLLEMYRIPRGKNEDGDAATTTSKRVVFVMHGMLSSSADYVMTGPERGLAFLLADLGYDVWLGNPRGTHYTRKHATHNADSDAEFWKFSFHEIGIYDLPAMIDLILETSGCETLSYIGTSQGTTAFYVLASEKPEYNKRIEVMIALAPSAYVSNMRSPLVRLGINLHRLLLPLAAMLGLMELPPKVLSPVITYFHEKCHNEGFLQDAVIQVLFITCGYSYDQLKREDIPVILSNVPHPASLYQLYHFAQNCLAGAFRKFDYGAKMNLQRYGAEIPPAYDLSKVTCPVALYYSNGDYLSQPQDVLRLYNELPNCVCLHKIDNETFNHLDFVYGADVVELLYAHVFKTLEKYATGRVISDDFN